MTTGLGPEGTGRAHIHKLWGLEKVMLPLSASVSPPME